MTTFTALTTLPGKEPAEALGLALENLSPEPMGIGVFEIEDGSGLWEIGAYFTAHPDEIALDILAAAYGAKPFAVSELPEKDWVAEVRRELTPVEAGRFFVYGGHDADKVPADKISLLIEAAMAFGTGHHGTTQGCLQALDTLATDGFVAQNAIDVGCGTAVLAMGAAKLWGKPVLASDIDQIATETSAANAVSNGLGDLISVVTCAGFEDAKITQKAPYDLVFANILKGPLLGLAQPMATHMQTGGYAILSGILNPQADEVIACYQENDFGLISRIELGEWTTLTLQRT